MKTNVTISIDPRIWKRFQLFCITEEISASAMVEKLITRACPSGKRKKLPTLAEQAKQFDLLRKSQPDRFKQLES